MGGHTQHTHTLGCLPSEMFLTHSGCPSFWGQAGAVVSPLRQPETRPSAPYPVWSGTGQSNLSLHVFYFGVHYGGNPCKYGENMQITHRKAQEIPQLRPGRWSNPGPSSCVGVVLTTVPLAYHLQKAGTHSLIRSHPNAINQKVLPCPRLDSVRQSILTSPTWLQHPVKNWTVAWR